MMDRVYEVQWSQTALLELANIRAYPPEVKERIFLDTFDRLSTNPKLTAKPLKTGELEGYWARLGLYQVILLFEVDEEKLLVSIDGIKHKRENFSRMDK